MSNKLVDSIIKNEDILIKLVKKSEESLLEHLTLLGLLTNRKDILIITNKRILLVSKSKVIKNKEYTNFSKIKFNPLNHNLSFEDNDSLKQFINLNNFRISYKEIQYLKSKLNN
ncbi:hypothetical protein EVU94_01410 [Flavobacteriaceae bacterium 144Ye]|jgi:hypothetical protein|uniref:hypothetical protein n=1 Tax=Gaetbulibacter jejuensis TaxID=584607 RepID=UPI00101C22CB|nr:hypothetical protein EVU94_01410 [Flavobacteriaceae bacterium 144Ye]